MNHPLDRGHVYRIFLQCFDLEGEARERFLEAACADDPSLRPEIDALLAVARDADGRTQALHATIAGRELDLTGSTVGRFRLTGFLGEGGMGVVYRAERIDGVEQTVAVKLISTLGSALARSRFEHEAQHLARLEHPSVARLIDAGVDRGRAWIAMEYVAGQRIDHYCAQQQLDTRAIVRLLVRIAEAVTAAHQMLVVHSDIKPTNVLVSDQGRPRLIDFGISAAARDTDDIRPSTQVGGSLFSPGYAAPEQVQSRPVTVATDVFGLGALAYRLLAGVPIHAEVNDTVDYMIAIVERDVALPSRAALQVAGNAARARSLQGDLDAILCKALARDPRQRYASMAEFQADLERTLEDRPIRARRQTTLYRMFKFLRRNSLPSALAATAAIALAAAAAVFVVQSHRESVAREMATRRGEFLETLLKSANPHGGSRDVTVAELLDAAAGNVDQKMGSEPLVAASMLGLITETDLGLGRYEQGLLANARQTALLKSSGGSELDLARAVAMRAGLLRALGRWPEAIASGEDAVARLRRLHASADLRGALDDLGSAFQRSGRDRDAEAALREAISIPLESKDIRAGILGKPYRDLSIVLGEMGHYDDAVRYGNMALQFTRKELPPDDPVVLADEASYASILVGIHRGAEAEALIRDVIARELRVLGPEHKDTLLAQFVLLDDLVELHRDAEAAELGLRTARSMEATLGPDNNYAQSSWMLYATARCRLQPDASELAIIKRTYDQRRRTLPARHPLIAGAGLRVAACLYQLHRYDAAEAELLRDLGDLEVARGPQFRRNQEGYALLRDVYLAMGRRADAERWAAKVRSGT